MQIVKDRSLEKLHRLNQLITVNLDTSLGSRNMTVASKRRHQFDSYPLVGQTSTQR
tara:strand:+ start:2783 stop:2950 length:168 start_codon:yes stop_codon:yes gene_type:complete